MSTIPVDRREFWAYMPRLEVWIKVRYEQGWGEEYLRTVYGEPLHKFEAFSHWLPLEALKTPARLVTAGPEGSSGEAEEEGAAPPSQGEDERPCEEKAP